MPLVAGRVRVIAAEGAAIVAAAPVAGTQRATHRCCTRHRTDVRPAIPGAVIDADDANVASDSAHRNTASGAAGNETSAFEAAASETAASGTAGKTASVKPAECEP